MKPQIIECHNIYCRSNWDAQCHFTPKWVGESCTRKNCATEIEEAAKTNIQQLKAEILPILKCASVSLKADYYAEALGYINEATAKLSAF
jgi:hypothetical protein